MNLLLNYQNELLALLAIIIVVIIYLYITRQKDTLDKEHEVKLSQQQESQEKNQETIECETKQEDKQSKIIKDQEESFELDGKEEGEFIVEKTETQTVIQEEQIQPSPSFVKKDVPPHGKITKENFKEFAGQRILVAEDNIINQKVILGLLADSGIDVVIANDGIEALEILQADNNFSIILMDAHMPRMDGFEATRNIRRNPDYNHIVVIALSGDTAVDDIRKMKEAGMSEHLEKPLNIDALYDIFYAYSHNAENSIKQKTTTLKELDIEEGLSVSGNDREFYHEILQEFLNTYANADEEIKNFIDKKDTQAADRLLLDIIGVSANIGANKLQASAQKLKESLSKNPENSSSILLNFKSDLQNLLQEIKKHLS